ncbi:hypothetical protein IAT38_005960 [Cryptococcus sp. DSM 104549]
MQTCWEKHRGGPPYIYCTPPCDALLPVCQPLTTVTHRPLTAAAAAAVNMKLAVISTLALLGVASAQIATCIADCFATAAKAGGCSSYADASCVCGNTAYETSSASCITNCSAAEQQNATLLQQSVCNPNATASSATSTSLAVSDASATADSGSTSGAVRDYVGYGKAGAGVVLGVVGVLAGGWTIL